MRTVNALAVELPVFLIVYLTVSVEPDLVALVMVMVRSVGLENAGGGSPRLSSASGRQPAKSSGKMIAAANTQEKFLFPVISLLKPCSSGGPATVRQGG